MWGVIYVTRDGPSDHQGTTTKTIYCWEVYGNIVTPLGSTVGLSSERSTTVAQWLMKQGVSLWQQNVFYNFKLALFF